jgi:hypothetical protein
MCLPPTGENVGYKPPQTAIARFGSIKTVGCCVDSGATCGIDTGVEMHRSRPIHIPTGNSESEGIDYDL